MPHTRLLYGKAGPGRSHHCPLKKSKGGKVSSPQVHLQARRTVEERICKSSQPIGEEGYTLIATHSLLDGRGHSMASAGALPGEYSREQDKA